MYDHGGDDGTSVAIVGMAGRFPGARTIDQFWQNLRAGVCSVRPLADAGLSALGVTDLADPRLVKMAAIMDDPDLFDAAFFGYSPAEARIMDPQQRVFLETAWTALEHAGYDPRQYQGAIGIYGGATLSTYLLLNLARNAEVTGSIEPLHLHVGNAGDFLTTRVSYKLDLKGPSYQVSSACSTSLVAVHLACQSLLNEECDMALAGGVSINVRLRTGYRLLEGGMESPDGYCRAFDAGAQGAIFGCGVGVVVLKRLATALADGDTIHAVIKGSAINNDGSLKVGFTAPSVAGQAEVIGEALSYAGIAADSISYVEAHGTGTPLGDPIEIQALTRAFRATTDRRGYCAIGSVKTNVGHLESAAGVTSLIKTVLALKHRQIPPSLHFERPNPAIDFANSPFYVATRLIEWEAGATPRRAGVSSFGFGGTNAHVIVEEAPPSRSSLTSRPWQVLPLSARTATALETMTTNLAAHLQQHPELAVGDVAYTLQVGRRPFGCRRALICRDGAEAIEILESRDPRRLVSGTPTVTDRPVAFLFPGQGTQAVNMARGLYEHEHAFREHVDRAADLLRPHLGIDLRALLYPEPTDSQAAAERLNQTAMTQPALFVIEHALAQWWMALGVRPRAMLGHSIGEYVAACLAGVFSVEDALALVAARGRLMQELPVGSMLATSLSEAQLQPWLGQALSIAAVNGPTQTVASGPTDEIRALQARLALEGIESRLLQTSHAFHSAMMDPILEPFAAQVARAKRTAPRIPFISNVTGTWITAEQATDPRYWAAHLRRPVRFAEGLATLAQDPAQLLLEVGVGHTLGRLARAQPRRPAEQVILSSLEKVAGDEQTADVAALARTAAELWLHGVDVRWSGWYDGGEYGRRVPLPTYPFEGQRYWVDPSPEAAPVEGQADVAMPMKNPDVGEWCYLPGWAPAPPLPADHPETSGTWLILTDERVGFGIAHRLARADTPVVLVLAGERFARRDERAYAIDPRQPAQYADLLAAVQSDGRRLTGIVHCWGLTPPEQAISVDQAQDLGFYSVLFLAQALASQETVTGSISLIVIANQTQDVAGDEMVMPAKATLLGPCAVIPHEIPSLRCKSIDVTLPVPDTRAWHRLLDQLTRELTAQDAATAVAYRAQQRWLPTFQSLRLAPPDRGKGLLREGGVYLITGGLGEVGLTLAEYLARTQRARLALLRRSAFPVPDEWDAWLAIHPAQDATSQTIVRLQAMQQAGAEILVIQADVTDRAQMAMALERTLSRYGEINGIIHAAGLISAQSFAPILEADRAFVERTFHGVQQALTILAEIVAAHRPDFCVLTSSLSTLLGGFGAIAYASANLLVDAFAHGQNQTQACAWLSVDWDAWKLGNEDQGKYPESMLNAAIAPHEGAEVFGRLLAIEAAERVVISSTPLQQRLETLQRRGALSRSDLDQAATAAAAIDRSALQSDYVAPTTAYEREVAAIWQQVLGIERIGIHDDFFALGGHSLLVTQLLNKLHRVYPIEFSMRTVFERPTVAAIAALIEDTYRARAGARAQETPIREALQKAFPTDRHGLLVDYWRKKVALALTIDEAQIPPAGDLTAFDLRAIAPDLIWAFQQAFELQIYPTDIAGLHSIDDFARFTEAELDRGASLRQITVTLPTSLYERYEPLVRHGPRMKPARSRPAVKNPTIAFLHSSPRSGSTLLRVMLAGHPDLFSPPEMDILWYDSMRDWHRSLTNPEYGHGFDWTSQGLQWTFMELLGLGDTAIKAVLEDLAAKDTPIYEVYARLQALAQPRLLIDKSPTYSMSLDTLERAEDLFEQPRYIYLVRHPYSVIESFVRIRLDKLFGPNIYNAADVDPFVIAEKVWVLSNTNIQAFLSRVERKRQFLVRYEDLVGKPRAIMEELCAFLEVPFDPAVLQPYDDKRERMITGIGDPNILRHTGIDASLADAWRGIRLPRRLGEPASRLAATFGYELPGVPGAVPRALESEPLAAVDAAQAARLLERIDELSPDEVTALLQQLRAR